MHWSNYFVKYSSHQRILTFTHFFFSRLRTNFFLMHNDFSLDLIIIAATQLLITAAFITSSIWLVYIWSILSNNGIHFIRRKYKHRHSKYFFIIHGSQNVQNIAYFTTMLAKSLAVWTRGAGSEKMAVDKRNMKEDIPVELATVEWGEKGSFERTRRKGNWV